jgi:predicted  nucleic acid-binding Zn-ribbon protein
MDNTTNTAEVTTRPTNPIDQYKQYISERTARREEIKAQIAALSEELKSINNELDGEKSKVVEMRALLVQGRKRRESKAPVATDPTTGEVITRKRGRKSNAQKAAEAATKQ